jgi:hypothetical protein|tara:strand:+ start:73 stop:387 length:315 start_codon:yes stop_codon:yes gene_type:complete
MADLLSTDGLKADCGAADVETSPTDILAAVTSPFLTMQGFPVVLAGTTVGGVAVVSTNTSITVGGVAVLTTDDVAPTHVTTTIPPVTHTDGTFHFSSNATSATV